MFAAKQVNALDNFNIDFGGDEPSDAYGAAGGQPGFWNSPGIPSSNGEELFDLDGIETTIMITSTGFQAAGGGIVNSTDAQKLHDGAINQVNTHTTPWSLTITGIANGEYRVILYGPRNLSGNATGDYFVQDAVLPSASISNSGFRDHHGVTVTDGSINVRRDPTYTLLNGQSRYAVSGLQIIAVPEPSSLALLGIGGLLLVRRRR